jgi:thioredoxin 1
MEELSSGQVEEFIKKNRVAMVDFFAPWCGPCRALAPVIGELAEEFAGRAAIAKFNVDSDGALSEKYGIRSIPTMIFFKDGEAVETITGTRTREDLAQKLNGLLS